MEGEDLLSLSEIRSLHPPKSELFHRTQPANLVLQAITLPAQYRIHEDPVRTCNVNCKICKLAAKKIYIGAILLRNCSMLGLHVYMHVVKAIEGSYVVTCLR